MMPTRQGSFRLFRLAGITVFLHWSWFVVAVFEINARSRAYTSYYWNVLEYVALFLIVLMHEFGHALACRQVGGKAEQIVLWPLGGVAYVSPPMRPGATLWSIAAGPLVNVALMPVLFALAFIAPAWGWFDSLPDVFLFVRTIFIINTALLVFNVLPIYPLDGGQILRSLLWFFTGRARSLMIAAIVGFVGVAGLVVLAIMGGSIWTGIIAVFILLNCWGGLQQARMLARVDKLPRHTGEFVCPSCKQPPVSGPFWRCGGCGKPFDPFDLHGACPYCGAVFPVTQCLECGETHPFNEWVQTPPVLPSR